ALLVCGLLLFTLAPPLMAREADLAIPDLYEHGSFTILGQKISAGNLLFYGSFVIAGTLGISLFLQSKIKAMPAHKSMLDIAEIIFQTCQPYLIQQGKFLALLFAIIAVLMTYYFRVLQHKDWGTIAQVMLFSIVGIGGS